MAKATFKRKTFPKDTTYLPVTMEQFEALTNEILTAVNEVSTPHFIEADYLAQVLMGAIHALKHETGMIKKTELFESCINRISCHVTYHVVQEIQAKLKAKEAAEKSATTTETPDNVVSLEQESS